MKVSVIIPAAGLGTRMGRSSPEKAGISRKQFMLLRGSPILIHTIRKFVSSPLITEIVVALREDDVTWAGELFHTHGLSQSVRTVAGGETRQQSVENALAAIADDTELVAVHDAVRPFIEKDIIEKVIREAAETGAAIVGIVPVDTVKQVHRNKVRATLPRERLILTQTPQVFRLGSFAASLRTRAAGPIHRHRRVVARRTSGAGRSFRRARHRSQHQNH